MEFEKLESAVIAQSPSKKNTPAMIVAYYLQYVGDLLPCNGDVMQYLAACPSEIARLREENQRLKQRVALLELHFEERRLELE